MKALTILLLGALSVSADTSGRRDAPRDFSWKSFKPGSFSKYKMIIDFGNGRLRNRQMGMEIRLKAVSRTQATLETTTIHAGRKSRSKTTKCSLKASGPMWGLKTGWIEHKGKREIIKAAGRTFSCKRIDYKQMQGRRETLCTIWTSPKVPSGIVKYIIRSDKGAKYSVIMELQEFTRK